MVWPIIARSYYGRGSGKSIVQNCSYSNPRLTRTAFGNRRTVVSSRLFVFEDPTVHFPGVRNGRLRLSCSEQIRRRVYAPHLDRPPHRLRANACSGPPWFQVVWRELLPAGDHAASGAARWIVLR